MKKTTILSGLVAATILSTGLYAGDNLNACVGCHGKNFEKSALGKSKIVKDMSKQDIVKALKGYKDGTYGGSMKGVMAGQVKNIKDVDATAKEIVNRSAKKMSFIEKAKVISAEKYNKAKKYAVTIGAITAEKAKVVTSKVKEKYKNTLAEYKVDSNSSRGKIISKLKNSETCFALADTDKKMKQCESELSDMITDMNHEK